MRIPKNLPGQEVAKLVPLQVALQLQAVPLAIEEGLLTVAMAAPDDRESLDALKKASGQQIFPVWSPPDQIEAALERLRHLCDG